ncbi:FGGY family carbohydrate kinase [Kutzneria kofuensis]|uniref:Gluconokinase n=1 Tax=Kutzneria kofuensis TaxID=103725 RepID=A0A7W9KPM2_9PSEU|nr:FGGY family carbohydrate kinase [Kutzneria kofuensis]MBB5896305.1 gluconokinase [Kutzneria kofuensis]
MWDRSDRDWDGSAAIGVEIGVDRVAAVSVSDDFTVIDTTCLRPVDEIHDIAGIVDPESVVDATFAAVRQVALACAARGYMVASVAFSAAAEEAVIAVDPWLMAMTPAISCLDNATLAVARVIGGTAGDEILASTGVAVTAGSAVARMAWFVAHHDVPAYARWCGLKDYVASRFYGSLVSDVSTASSMGLLDLGSMTWSAAALRPVGLRPEQLPPLVASEQILPLDEEAAELAGLDRRTPVTVGASAACLSSLAMGLYRPRSVMVHPGLVGRLCSLHGRPGRSVPSTAAVGGSWLLTADGIDSLRAEGVDIDVIRVASDMRQSPEVAAAIANTHGVIVEISDVAEPAAVGAAMLAWYARGVLPAFGATADLFPPHTVVRPRGG